MFGFVDRKMEIGKEKMVLGEFGWDFDDFLKLNVWLKNN
jgi:hypothetical protein